MTDVHTFTPEALARHEEVIRADERRRCADVVRGFKGNNESNTAQTMNRIFEEIAVMIEETRGKP